MRSYLRYLPLLKEAFLSVTLSDASDPRCLLAMLFSKDSRPFNQKERALQSFQ